MKWIRLLGVFAFLSHSTFLFADGKNLSKDTLPGDKIVKQLPTVVLRRPMSLGRSSGDTLIFDAQRYARPTAFRLEELLKDVPGFRVDGEGRIYFNGKEISRIMIDGDDLAGDRYQMLSRNLRSAMADKIELIQSHQPNRLLKGLLPTESIAINIRLKNEFKGKLSGGVTMGLGFKKLQQQEAEALWMKEKWKEMVFADFNNNGSKGYVETGAEKDPNGMPLIYDLHPFAFAFSDQQNLVSFGQMFRNEEMRLTSLGQFSFGEKRKMNLSINGGGHELQQEYLTKRNIVKNNVDPLVLLGQIKMQRKSEQFLLRTEWYNDIRKDQIVKNILQLGYDHANHGHFEIRQGSYAYDMNTTNQERQLKMQWDREGTRKLVSGMIMQIKTRLAIGGLSTETFSSTAHLTDSFVSTSLTQQLYRKGLLFDDDIHFLSVRKSIKWKLGWRSSIENALTKVEKNDFDYRMIKSFPYAELNWLPTKKITSFTQLAGGVAIHGDALEHRQILYLIEQKIQWKFRRLLQLYLAGGISRKSGNMRDLYAGAILNREGLLIDGNGQMNFPQYFHLRAGGTQVDLYSGRSWSLMLQYQKKMNELGQGLVLTDMGERRNRLLLGTLQNCMVDLQAEQYVSPLKSKIRLNFHASATNSPLFINGIIEQYFMHNLMFDIRFVHQSQGPLGGELQFQQSMIKNRLVTKGSLPYRVVQKAIVSKFWWRCNPKANIQFSYTMIQTSNMYSAHLIDLNYDVKIGEKMQCAIVGQNLLHQKLYRALSNDPFGIAETAQRLNGRRILFQCRYFF